MEGITVVTVTEPAQVPDSTSKPTVKRRVYPNPLYPDGDTVYEFYIEHHTS